MDINEQSAKFLLDRAIEPGLESIDIVHRILANEQLGRRPRRTLGVAAGVSLGLVLAIGTMIATKVIGVSGSSSAIEVAAAPPACPPSLVAAGAARSEEHTSELQSHSELVCRLLLEKKKERHAAERARACH